MLFLEFLFHIIFILLFLTTYLYRMRKSREKHTKKTEFRNSISILDPKLGIQFQKYGFLVLFSRISILYKFIHAYKMGRPSICFSSEIEATI